MGHIYRTATAFTGTGAAALPVVPDALPVGGVARRWDAGTIAAADGSVLTGWVDNAAGTTLAVSAGNPRVETLDGLRVVRFTNDILQQGIALGQPHTVAIAFKHVTINTSGTASIFGAQQTIDADGGIFQTNTVGDFYANAGAGFRVGMAKATTGWHRLIASFNGADSVVRLNGTEYVGNTGSLPRAGFSLGGQRGRQFTDIAVTHASIFPAALTAAERGAMDTWLTQVTV